MGRMGLRYPVVLQPLSEEEGGGWLAQIPDLPGCVSDGETPEEALRAVEEAQDAWLKVARARRVRVPLPVKEGLHALRLHPSPEREAVCEARARLDELAGAAYEAYWGHVQRALPTAVLPPALWLLAPGPVKKAWRLIVQAVLKAQCAVGDGVAGGALPEAQPGDGVPGKPLCCGECPVWAFAGMTRCWPPPLARKLGFRKEPDHECARSAGDLRAEAACFRVVAAALDRAAELRASGDR